VISQTAAVLIPTLFLLRRHLRHMEGTLAQPLAVPVAEIAPGGPE
jgi:hypothetical protein